MAKVYFRYAAMNAGKSTQLLQVRHNYHERHQQTLLLKPHLDNRDGENFIKPRIGGLEVKVDALIFPDTDLQVMVEECRDSVTLARFNVNHHRLAHVKILEGKVETHLPEVLKELNGKSCTALIDPPRGGLAGSAIETLGEAKSLESLFYLSCSPESLARDLKCLAQAGWQVRKIMPFDFFPRTRHLETLVWLARS